MFGELQGKADKDVLQVFRGAYEEASRGNNDALTIERKINLAAILINVANMESDPCLCPASFLCIPCQTQQSVPLPPSLACFRTHTTSRAICS
jgi:hypothetical protein